MGRGSLPGHFTLAHDARKGYAFLFAVERRKLNTSPCQHLGLPTGGLATCLSCGPGVRIKVFRCSIYGTCTDRRAVGVPGCCNRGRCRDYSPAQQTPQPSSNSL